MCLSFNKTATAKTKKMLKEKGQISVYKPLSTSNQALVSYGNFRWKAGENVSDRQSNALTSVETENGQIDHGFHACTKKFEGCLRMVGKAADFVASDSDGGIVFSKLTLPQSEYNKALGITEVKAEVKKPPAKKAPVKKAVKAPAKKAPAKK